MMAMQMGLHVFFGCYHNLFRLMTKCGVLQNLLVKEHTHTFVNAGMTPGTLQPSGWLKLAFGLICHAVFHWNLLCSVDNAAAGPQGFVKHTGGLDSSENDKHRWMLRVLITIEHAFKHLSVTMQAAMSGSWTSSFTWETGRSALPSMV